MAEIERRRYRGDWNRHTHDIDPRGPESFEAEAKTESGKAAFFWAGILVGIVWGIVISWFCPWVRH